MSGLLIVRVACGFLSAVGILSSTMSIVWLVSFWQGGDDQLIKTVVGVWAAVLGSVACCSVLAARAICVWRKADWPGVVFRRAVVVQLSVCIAAVLGWGIEWVL